MCWTALLYYGWCWYWTIAVSMLFEEVVLSVSNVGEYMVEVLVVEDSADGKCVGDDVGVITGDAVGKGDGFGVFAWGSLHRNGSL